MLDHWLLLVFAPWKLPKFHNENIPPGLARVARRKTARSAPAQHQLLIALRSSKRGRNLTNNIKHVFPSDEGMKSWAASEKKFSQNFVLILLSHITSFSFSFIFLFSPMPLTCCWCCLLCRIIWFRVFPLLFHPKGILIKESFPIFMLKLILLLYPLSDAIFSAVSSFARFKDIFVAERMPRAVRLCQSEKFNKPFHSFLFFDDNENCRKHVIMRLD